MSLLSKKNLFSVVKYSVAVALLYYVLHQIDLVTFSGYIKKFSVWMVIAALLAFNIGQVICAERMRYYYVALGQPMSRQFALISYYVGIFYNLVLPGGVGGDAYRVYLFKKVANLPVGQSIRIQLANRLNGLLVMGLMILVAMGFIDFGINKFMYFGGLVAAALLGVAGYFILMKLFIKEEAQFVWGALPYSIAAQLCGLVTFAIIWAALSHGEHFAAYTVLFLTALIASMIPVTIAGLGIREFVFLHGAEWINQYTPIPLSPELGVAFSLSFFAITAITSFIGLFFIGKSANLAVG